MWRREPSKATRKVDRSSPRLPRVGPTFAKIQKFETVCAYVYRNLTRGRPLRLLLLHGGIRIVVSARFLCSTRRRRTVVFSAASGALPPRARPRRSHGGLPHAPLPLLLGHQARPGQVRARRAANARLSSRVNPRPCANSAKYPSSVITRAARATPGAPPAVRRPRRRGTPSAPRTATTSPSRSPSRWTG